MGGDTPGHKGPMIEGGCRMGGTDAGRWAELAGRAGVERLR